MVEKLRLFRGGTELKYSQASITKTSDTVANKGKCIIEADATVTQGSVIDFKKADGSTTIFSAKVIEKTEKDMWVLQIMSNGYELQNVIVQQVYENKSPEFIVQDIVDNFTSTLTYASIGSSSGVIIEKYIANAYAVDIIKEMMDILQWQLRIDENDNLYFEPKGTTNNGITLTNGTTCQIVSRKEDSNNMFNRVKIKGGQVTRNTIEVKSGTGTQFTLLQKPAGVVRATISGSEVIMTAPDTPYSTDSENKTITHNTSVTDPTYEYEFSLPVVVDDQNDEAIADIGYEIMRRIDAPWLVTFSDARRYAQNLLNVFSVALIESRIVVPGMDFTLDVGEEIIVVDPIRSRTETLVISRIKYVGEKNQTEITAGTRTFVFFDWLRETQDRIKKLERRIQDESDVAFSRNFKHNMSVTLTKTETWKQASPVDSFILGHKTLSRLRPDLNFEADCSDNAHHGIWQGTGIEGSQYSTGGWRLSEGTFNGSDNYIDITDHSDLDLSGDFSIALAVKVASLPGAEKYILNKWDGTDGYAVRINASDQVELIYSNSGSDSTIAATTALTANTYQHIVFTKIGTDLVVYVNGTSNNTGSGDAAAGTNANNVQIGRYSADYFNGNIDEVRFYNGGKDSGEVADLWSDLHIDKDQAGYWSMDNPRLGDRFTTPAVIS